MRIRSPIRVPPRALRCRVCPPGGSRLHGRFADRAAAEPPSVRRLRRRCRRFADHHAHAEPSSSRRTAHARPPSRSASRSTDDRPARRRTATVVRSRPRSASFGSLGSGAPAATVSLLQRRGARSSSSPATRPGPRSSPRVSNRASVRSASRSWCRPRRMRPDPESPRLLPGAGRARRAAVPPAATSCASSARRFEGPVRVFFGGLPAEVLSVTSNTIRVRTPRNDSVPRGAAVCRSTSR